MLLCHTIRGPLVPARIPASLRPGACAKHHSENRTNPRTTCASGAVAGESEQMNGGWLSLGPNDVNRPHVWNGSSYYSAAPGNTIAQ